MRLTYVTSVWLLIAITSCQQNEKNPAVKSSPEKEVWNDDRNLASEAEFPGGTLEWNKLITTAIEQNMDALTDENLSGTVVVSFTVDTNGQVINPRAESCCESDRKNCLSPDSKLAEVAVNAVKNGPKWEPAKRISDGKAVRSIRKQPVTFRLEQS